MFIIANQEPGNDFYPLAATTKASTGSGQSFVRCTAKDRVEQIAACVKELSYVNLCNSIRNNSSFSDKKQVKLKSFILISN